MSLKKLLIIRLLFVFGLSFITHNIYDWYPTFFTSIFFPVNESIWEHQKMIFTTILIWGIVEYFILKNKNMNYSNVISSVVLSAILNVIIFLIIYTPIYIIFGHNLIVILIIYFITIAVSQILEYIILKIKKHFIYLNVLSVILVLFIYLMFGLLTYYPIRFKPLFYDPNKKIYGIED